MSSKTARFETRWTPSQKELFEKASIIGGFKNLSEFVLYTVQRQAEEIVEEHQNFLRSKKDQEIFIEAILNPPEPNAKLKKAAKKYFDSIKENASSNQDLKFKR